MISDPTFTVDVAQSDDKLRRIAARMTIEDESGEKGTVSLSIQLKDVDKPVTITPPASGRPLEELMRSSSRTSAPPCRKRPRSLRARISSDPGEGRLPSSGS